ncbi:META domain-containing protein [Salinicola socius]|uniref:META domain-containing protein n=1 Tax=Salinicola socius TaxID=404433 RepID=UPI0009FF98F4|nr:META domain-containing protein [Salinicola socius]
MLTRFSLLTVAAALAAGVAVSGCTTNPGASDANTVPDTRADSDTRAASEALVGTYWKLMTLDGKPVTVADNMREAHLVLDAQGRVTGSTGCNRLMGSYTLQDDTLTFSQLASTRMACPGEVAALEQAWLATLSETAHYSIEGQSLVLEDAGDHALAELKANALY